MPFTADECKVIALTATKVVDAVGRDSLSVEFRQSFVNWLGPNTACDGPADIQVPTAADVAAFNTIRLTLASGSNPIDLTGRGVRAVH